MKNKTVQMVIVGLVIFIAGMMAGMFCSSYFVRSTPEINPGGGVPRQGINCPPGTYAGVGNPDEGWQCFSNGTMHTL